MHKSEESLKHFKQEKIALLNINVLDMFFIPIIISVIQSFWIDITHITVWFSNTDANFELPTWLWIFWFVQLIVLCLNSFCKFGTKLKWYRYL